MGVVFIGDLLLAVKVTFPKFLVAYFMNLDDVVATEDPTSLAVVSMISDRVLHLQISRTTHKGTETPMITL